MLEVGTKVKFSEQFKRINRLARDEFPFGGVITFAENELIYGANKITYSFTEYLPPGIKPPAGGVIEIIYSSYEATWSSFITHIQNENDLVNNNPNGFGSLSNSNNFAFSLDELLAIKEGYKGSYDLTSKPKHKGHPLTKMFKNE